MPRKTATKAQTQSTKSKSEATNASHGQKGEDEVSFDIITPESWNVKEHKCGAAKANKSGQGKSAPFTYGGRKFFLKVPKMYSPFGASKPIPKPGEKTEEKYSIQMAFGDDPECQLFQSKAGEFDKFMIDKGSEPENCVGWLGASKTKLFSREVVESKYSPMIKYSKKDGEINTQYPPFIRAGFPTTFKEPLEFTCEIYDKNNNLLQTSLDPNSPHHITKVIPPGIQCSALLSGSIWATSSGFGVTWRIAQMKIFPLKGLPKGKCLVDDPESSSEDSNESTSEVETELENEEGSKGEGSEEGEVVEVEEFEEETTPVAPPVQTTPAAKKPLGKKL